VTLSVIIPAFNEARQIESAIAQLVSLLQSRPWDWDIRVVDDGSSDGTAEIVEPLARGSSRVRLQREPHRGKGGAVKAGMLAAGGDVRFLCDADLSMPPAELDRLMAALASGADIVIASREGKGARRVGEPWRRHATGRVFNFLIRQLVLGGISDTQCGFKLFTARAAASVFPRVTLDGWAFDVEALAIARALDLRIVEVPIEWHYRRESRLSIWRDAGVMLRDILRVRGRLRRGGLLS
jgi:dolichyl-phosphate beta-glucosyltransferase